MTLEHTEKPAKLNPHVSGRPAMIGPILAGAMAFGVVALQPVAASAQANKGEGFENKLAELFAAKLGKKLSYTYFPQATGFVRMTLGSFRCDIIMGFPQGDDQAQVTVPYYRTTYALVTKRGSGLEDVTAIDDPKLKDKRIGIVAKTPPSTNMAMNGLLGHAK